MISDLTSAVKNAQEGLSEEGMLELRPEGQEGPSHGRIWESKVQAEGTAAEVALRWVWRCRVQEHGGVGAERARGGGEMGRSLITWDLWDPAKSLPRSLVGILGPFLLVRKIKLGRVKWHAHGQIKIRTHYQNRVVHLRFLWTLHQYLGLLLKPWFSFLSSTLLSFSIFNRNYFSMWDLN